jgi:hypothetical protein
MTLRWIAMLLGLLCLTTEGIAQDPAPQPTPAQIEAWKALPEAEKVRLRERLRALKAMPADRQAELQQRWTQYRSLTPAQKTQLKARWARYQALNPAE